MASSDELLRLVVRGRIVDDKDIEPGVVDTFERGKAPREIARAITGAHGNRE